jgi:hypothetical protein
MQARLFLSISAPDNDNGIVEVVSLTADDKDNCKAIDIDAYILEVLLVKVIKANKGAALEELPKSKVKE